jgi:hypothetical protein
MELFVHRYHIYIKNNRLKHSDKNLIIFRIEILKVAKFKKEENVPNGYGCGELDHLKSECPKLTKASRKSNFNFNGKRKERRTYIA